jgi:FkbM family methyltransferase
MIGKPLSLKKILYAKTNPVVIDVGCNVGEFSELVFELNDSSVIKAFDLHRSLSPILNKKFKKFYFNFSQIALSNYSGYSNIVSNTKNDRKAFIAKKSNSKSIKVDKLDNILKQFKFSSVAIIKIDTEGNDYKVLLGAEKILRITDLVIFEVMYKILEYGNTPQDAINFLKSLDFRYFYRSTKYFGLVPISNIKPHEIMTQNIVASRINLR